VNSRIKHVLDSSAILAVMAGEPGQELVQPLLVTAAITAVNACEVISKLISRNMSPDEAIGGLLRLEVEVAAFESALAFEAARLLPLTRTLGLSLGDRACLAFARFYNVPAVTADRAWKKLASKLSVDIRVIR